MVFSIFEWMSGEGGVAKERRQQEAFRLFRFQWSSCHFLSAAASPASSPASASRTDNGASTEAWRVLLLPPLPPVGFSKSLQLTWEQRHLSQAGGTKNKHKKQKQAGSVHRARAPSPRLRTA